MIGRKIVLALAVFAAALLLTTLQTDVRAADRPNIVFIMADDLGYGDLGCYGQEKIKTPRIDQMAAEGMKFTQFYAGSTVCAPSRCVLMTGLHTGHCYIRGNGKINLRPKDFTVAELLQDAGYATGLFGKWGLGHEGSTGVPTKQGFDEFFGYMDQHHAHNYYPTYLLKGEERFPLDNIVERVGRWGQGEASEKKEWSHALIMEEALDFIDRKHGEPFFLYLALTIPHANNEAGKRGMLDLPSLEPYEDKDWPLPEKGTAAMIHHLDTDVGRLLDRLEKHGIDENTIVFFTSDNGPHHEGGRNPNFFDSSGPLQGTKRALYEGGIRVPMIARWPGHVPAGETSDYIGYFADLMPTAAEIADVQLPVETDGISFLPACLGEEEKQKQHDLLYWEFYEQGGRRAVRMGNWKGIEQPWGTDKIELYDLSKDIGEAHNIADAHPAIVAKVKAAIEREHVPNPLWKPPVGKQSK